MLNEILEKIKVETGTGGVLSHINYVVGFNGIRLNRFSGNKADFNLTK